MRQNLLALAVFASLLPIGAAQGQPLVQSQEGIALENQILQLQSQVQQLQAGGGGNGGSVLGGTAAPPPPTSGGAAPGGGIVATLLNQVNDLQTQVQQLSGRVDTLQNQVDTQHAATEKEIGDLKFQMTNGATSAASGAPGAASGAPAPQTSAPPAAPAPAVSGSPETMLHDGLAAYARHDYTAAETAAKAILSTAKGSPQAYRAQYLLGQSLSAEGKPQAAAIAYDSAYNFNRTGSWAPQSLYGLASSLADINQDQAACDTLSSLNSQFPAPPAGMKSKIDALSHRAHCS
ncbi:tol-pal system YbgF family protein [Acidocella sp.]|uniref:tetratricopeptide repeat protein n=1 Tax=Acidocella sp. TaxID=50710 RepID=UPI0018260B45|nr:tetratricopeptide repeat protein [Acidocella sp.]NNM56544.1 tetratricopeptide repeat protein [Acidocella sp.]